MYSLCVAYPEPLADKLYAETKQFLENHVQNILATQVAPPIDTSTVPPTGPPTAHTDSSLLMRYYVAWTEYSQGIEFLNYLYLYLNTQHIKSKKISEAEYVYGNINSSSQEQLEIGELGLDIWRTQMIQVLSDELVEQLLRGIKADRTATDMGVMSTQIIHGVVQSFVLVQDYRKKSNLKMYQDIFEAPMLAASGEYYRGEAAKLLQLCSVSEYMEEVIKRLDDEARRAQKLLHTRYWLLLISSVLHLSNKQCVCD